jgi:O-methyltransferase
VIPSAAMFHKDYQDFSPEKRLEVQKLLQQLMVHLGANEGNDCTLHDDLFVWFRNLFFTTDPRFDAACGSLNFVLRARLWRLYTLCWACEQALDKGDIVDIGVYDGRALEVVLRYQTSLPAVHAYDLFDAVPEEARKADHGPDLYEQVCQRLAPFNAVVHKGDIRNITALPEQIGFCQIDLNNAEAEGYIFPLVYERLQPGSIVVFDDYGFRRYRESALTHQRFLQGKEQVLELPTGQGLLVKR